MKRYDDRYLVSPCGNIFDVLRSRWIAHRNHSLGYSVVSLHCKSHYVHRIVASLYCDGFAPELEVNHKDGNKKNNSFLNLEWKTKSYNIKHSFDMGLNRTPRERIMRMARKSAENAAIKRADKQSVIHVDFFGLM